jgi:hypothetical protein
VDENPYQAPSPEVAALRMSGEGVRSIAALHRRFLVCIAVNVVLFMGIFITSVVVLAPRVSPFIVLAFWASSFVTAVVAFQLTRQLGDTVLAVIFALLMLMPCLSLVLMLIINAKATLVLRRNGYQVGLFGAHPPDSH